MLKLLLSPLLLLSFAGFAQFANHKDIITQSVCVVSSMYSEDLDGDGDKDLVASSSGDGKISWFENTGGSFPIQTVICDTVFGAGWAIAADVDNDGNMDVLSASGNNDKVAWYKNLGNGEFGMQQVINTLSNTSFITAADLDNDGDVDIISSSSSSAIWQENLGNGNFGPNMYLFFGLSITRITVNDLDGDGFRDVLFSSSSQNTITWLKNNGNGTFSGSNIITNLPTYVISVSCEDMDNDGDADIITQSTSGDAIYYIQNLSNGNFANPVVIYTLDEPQFVTVADMDSDSDKDIIFTSNSTGEIGWLENLGSGNFGAAQILLSGQADLSFVVPFDIDGDTDMDLIFTCEKSRIAALKNNGTGYLQEDILYNNGTALRAAITSDVDQDGDEDLILSTWGDERIAMYENLGGNVFSSQIIITTAVDKVKSLFMKDLDNDGDLDLLAAISSSAKIVWYPNTAGVFGTEQLITLPILNPLNAISADLDGDGHNDVITSYTNKICWYRNLGGGIFDQEQIISVLANNPIDIEAADIDNDGDMDLVSASEIDNAIAWFINDGNAAFTREVINDQLNVAESVLVNDFDNDGFLDVVYTSYEGNEIGWHRNLGSGNFSVAQVINSTAVNPHNLHSADLDGDGDQEIAAEVTGSSNSNTQIWHDNLGNGNFSASLNFGVPSFYSYSCGALLDDMDNDGDVDVLIPANVPIVYLLENLIFYPIQVKGKVFSDLNQNGIYDPSDIGFALSSVVSTPQSDFGFTLGNGIYSILFSDVEGDYLIYPQPIPYWSLTTDSTEFHIHIDSNFTVLDSLDFGFYPDTVLHELSLGLIGGFPRCNQVVNYWVNISNTGTTLPSGIIKLQLDSLIEFVDADLMPDSISGQNVYWNYDSLIYFEHKQIKLQVQMPTFLFMGDTMASILYTNVTDAAGIVLEEFSDTLNQVLVCAYDPNDKAVQPAGKGSPGYIHVDNEWLEYTVRFQNTGNDTALVVRIKDQLDPNLDWLSMQVLSASHQVLVNGEQNGLVNFEFNSIYLPDSNVNEIASHGYINYRIKLKDNLPVGTQILNTANIYFDFNPAVVTNTTINTLFDCEDPVEAVGFDSGYCFGSTINGLVNASPGDNISWEISGITLQAGENFSWNADSLGTFQLHVLKENDLCRYEQNQEIIVTNCLSINEYEEDMVKVFPNPFNGSINLTVSSFLSGGYDLAIYDVAGRIVFLQFQNKGENSIIDLSHLDVGIYLIQITEPFTGSKFNVQLLKK